MHLSSVIPANDTRDSVSGLRNFPRREWGSNLGPLAPEASVVTTELPTPLNATLFITHVSSCELGATPMLFFQRECIAGRTSRKPMNVSTCPLLSKIRSAYMYF